MMMEGRSAEFMMEFDNDEGDKFVCPTSVAACRECSLAKRKRCAMRGLL
jgi:hypothetical protein